MGQTAAYFGLSIEDLCGTSRSRVLVTARHIAMYLCRELTDMSLPKIGQQFGGRDHTTVINADRKIRSLMAERRSIYTQVTELTNRIKQQARTELNGGPRNMACGAQRHRSIHKGYPQGCGQSMWTTLWTTQWRTRGESVGNTGTAGETAHSARSGIRRTPAHRPCA